MKLNKKTKKNKQTKRRTNKNKTRKSKSFLYKYQPPKTKEFIRVSNLHTVAYYTFGNKKGIPCVFIHGGPGACIDFNLSKMFNLKKYYVIAIDQRGCGKSTPHGETHENTTQYLAEDMEKIREHLGIQKWLVFGGSWGSLMAIYYAQKYTERVLGIVVRGIFMGTNKEMDLVENGNLIRYIYPDIWERYTSILNRKELLNPAKAYEKKLRGDEGEKEKNKAAYHYSFFQEGLHKLHPSSNKINHRAVIKDKTNFTLSHIPYHFFGNKCFLPRDGYLLETKNMNKLKNIPVEIIQGIYDMTTPAYVAYELHKKLPHSRLHMVVSGHSGSDYETIKQTIKSLKRF